MKRAIMYAVIGAVVVMGVVFGAGPVQRRFRELRSDQALIRGDTGDVMASATYQRFQAQRQAIAAMREDLRRLASAESAFIADSGRPTTDLIGTSYSTRGRGNIGPNIQIKQDRWIGTMTNSHTPVMCQVTGMLDTAGRQRGSAEVQCLGWAAVESTWAVAQREEASRAVPPAPPDQPLPPPTAPMSRRHRDWGPLNNTPPPQPLVRKNTGPSEYSHYGRWMARKPVPAFREKRAHGSPVFVLEQCERFTATTGDVHIERPGIIVFRQATVNPPTREGPEVDSIAFTPRDTLFLLHHIGEGYVLWWFRGQIDTGYMFWEEDEDPKFVPDPADTVALVQAPVVTWWVRARNRAGREGWVRYDYASMATGGYMDEIGPCAPTEK